MCRDCQEIVCKICGVVCKNISSLSHHLKSHKINLLNYMVQYEGFQIPKCPICGKDCKAMGGILYRKTCGSKMCNKSMHEKTCMTLYKVKHPSMLKSNRNKARKTTFDRFGFIYASQSPDVKNKIKKTFLDKYGVDNPLKLTDIRKKSIKTCLKKYGKENYSKTEEYKIKYRKTCKDRYGCDSALVVPSIRNKQNKTKLLKFLPICIERYSEDFDDIHIDGFDVVGACKKCGHIESLNNDLSFQRKNKYKVPVCTNCNPIDKRYSIKEKMLCEFIKSVYGGPVIENDRIALKGCGKNGWPMELDIYLPEKKLAFEFNGDYWHSPEVMSAHKISETYHEDKAKSCADKGIELVYVWESDWDNNRSRVESMICDSLK